MCMSGLVGGETVSDDLDLRQQHARTDRVLADVEKLTEEMQKFDSYGRWLILGLAIISPIISLVAIAALIFLAVAWL